MILEVSRHSSDQIGAVESVKAAADIVRAKLILRTYFAITLKFLTSH